MLNLMRPRGTLEGSVSYLSRQCARMRRLKVRGWASQVMRPRGVFEKRLFWAARCTKQLKIRPRGEPLESLGRRGVPVTSFWPLLGCLWATGRPLLGSLGRPWDSCGLALGRPGAASVSRCALLASLRVHLTAFGVLGSPFGLLRARFGRHGAASASPSPLSGSVRASLGPLVGLCDLSLDSFRFLWVPWASPAAF